MSFSVTKLSPELVTPAEPTPSTTLPLSVYDRWLSLLRNVVMDVVLVFPPGVDEPPKVVRKALSAALVPYYPVAGRLVQASPADSLEVACKGEGVWFIEASADFGLDEVDYLQSSPVMVPKEQLFPSPPPEVNLYDLPLLMQVTQFRCGSFAVSVRFNHAIFDGKGIGQFMKAVGEMAEGLSHPTIKPIWSREAFPLPSRSPPGIPRMAASFKFFKFERLEMDVSKGAINALKNEFTKQTGDDCTEFEVLTAKIWQCRTRAVNIDPDVGVGLTFGVDIRGVQQIVPPEGGYYGNCTYNGLSWASSAKIVNGSLVEMVNLIKDAKKIIPSRVSKWLEGDAGEDPYTMHLGYESMLIVDWRRLGFFEVEFGSMRPAHVTHVGDTQWLGYCYLLKSPVLKQGVRLHMQCVLSEHLKTFIDEMNGWSSD